MDFPGGVYFDRLVSRMGRVGVTTREPLRNPSSLYLQSLCTVGHTVAEAFAWAAGPHILSISMKKASKVESTVVGHC